MDREAFRNRMLQFKLARESNPLLNYWVWKNLIEEYKGLDIDNDNTYDYREFYYSDPERAYDLLGQNPNAHFTDEFKTPLHPTFSNESIYSNDVTHGGNWAEQNGHGVFNHSDYTFDHSDLTLDYLKRNDPGVISTYKGGVVLPEVLVLPSYRDNSYITSYVEGGEVSGLPAWLRWLGKGYLPDDPWNAADYGIKYGQYTDAQRAANNGNKRSTDELVISDYIDKVMWPMENPFNKGLNKENGLYYVYKDVDADGVTRYNIGPGIESHSDMGLNLSYDNTKGYRKGYLDSLVNNSLLKATPRIVKSLNTMKGSRYNGVWDTLSIGPKLVIYDIYHNVKAEKRKNLPEKWPALIDALSIGDLETAKKETKSKSSRRLKMRNQLLKYGEIDKVLNKSDGGIIQSSSEIPVWYDEETGTFQSGYNPGAGFLSGTDPIAAEYVLGIAGAPIVNKLFKGAKWLGRTISSAMNNSLGKSTKNSLAIGKNGMVTTIPKREALLTNEIDRANQEFFYNDVIRRDGNFPISELEQYVDDANNFMYDVYPSRSFKSYVTGDYNKFSNLIRLNENYMEYNPSSTLSHEFRHRYDRSFPISSKDLKLLNKAYKTESDITVRGANSIDEKIATNTQVRNKFYNRLKERLGRTPTVQELNDSIDNLSDAEVLSVLGDTNAYGRVYVEKILKDKIKSSATLNKRYKERLVYNIKKALKTVPVGAGIVAPNIDKQSN